MRATVLVCLITGVLAAVEVYAGQLVWPDFSKYPDVDTAYVYVAGRAGGAILFAAVNATLLVANAGSGMGAQIGAARVMFSMGRDRALPRWFGYVHPSTAIPSRNVILCGVLALGGAWAITYQLGAELLNFGAFLAFSGVNAACFQRDFLKNDNRTWMNAAMPLLALAVCLYIWASLRWQAKIAGMVWVVAGLIYWMVTRKMAVHERE